MPQERAIAPCGEATRRPDSLTSWSEHRAPSSDGASDQEHPQRSGERDAVAYRPEKELVWIRWTSLAEHFVLSRSERSRMRPTAVGIVVAEETRLQVEGVGTAVGRRRPARGEYGDGPIREALVHPLDPDAGTQSRVRFNDALENDPVAATGEPWIPSGAAERNGRRRHHGHDERAREDRPRDEGRGYALHFGGPGGRTSGGRTGERCVSASLGMCSDGFQFFAAASSSFARTVTPNRW